MSELKFSVELDLKKLQQQVNEANRKLDSISKTAKDGAETASRASQKITQANKATADSFDRVAKMAKRAFGAFAVTDLARHVVSVRTQIDSLERSFVSLTQSAQKGQELTDWMKDFASKTPLTVQGLASATQTMLGFGVSADEAKKYITALGDISMGNQEKLNSLALAFSQMSATGKLMGQDLLQMINAGFNPLTEIARKTGKSVGELKENMGSIPLEEVKEAFISATEAGGLFNGMLEKQAEGMAGVQAKLRGNLTDALNKAGEENEALIKAGFKLASNLIKAISKLTPVITDAVLAYGSYKTALMITTAFEQAVAKAKYLHTIRTTALTRAQVTLNNAIKANPYGVAAAALTALVMVIYKFTTAKSSAEKANERFNKSLREENQLIEERRQKGEEALNVINNETASHLDQIKALETLKQLYPAIFENMDLKKAKTLSQLDAQRMLNEEESKSIELSARQKVDDLRGAVREAKENLKSAQEHGSSGLRESRKLGDLEEDLKLAEENLRKVESQRAEAEKEATKSKAKTVAEQVKELTDEIKAKADQIKELRRATATADTAKIEELQNEIQELEKKRALLTGRDKSKSGATKAVDQQARLKEEIQARREYEDLLSEQIASTIAIQADGVQKELQTIEEGHRLKIQAIQREREDLLITRQGKGKGLTAEEETGFATRMQAEQTLLEQSIAKRVDEETRANEDVLSQYLTYLQKREELIKKATEKEAQIRKSAEALGVDPTEYIEELQKQTDEALTALDEITAQKQASYRAWLEAIRDKSLDDLKEGLKKAREELKKLRADEGTSGDKLAVALSKVVKLEEKIEEVTARSEDTAKDSVVKWTDLAKVIDDASQSFERLGDEIGGVAGEIISVLGVVASGTTQIINGVKAIGATAKGAVSAVERASAVLAIASSVFKTGEKISRLFNRDKKKDEHIKALQAEIKDLQWELNNGAKLQHLQFDRSGAVIARYSKEVASVTKALTEANATATITVREGESLWIAFSRAGEERHKAFAKAIATSYKELDYTVTKALGADKFKDVARQVDNIAEQTQKLKQQQEEERSKKKSDKGAIADYEDQIRENALKAREIINKATDDIMGGDSQSIAHRLGDALIEAFKRGEDGAKAWGDTVNGIVSDIVKRMLISKLVEQPIGDIFDKYQKEWFGSDAKFKGIDAVTDSLPGLASELESAGVGMMEALKHLSPALEGVLKIADEAEDTRTAERKGIATASQESVDELNGRATAIQGHTYLIQEHTKELRYITNGILEEVTAIKANTDTLHDIKKELTSVRGSISEIQVKGVKTL